MEQIITTIRKMKVARKKMEDAMNEWDVMSRPVFSNTELIPEVHKIFKSVLGPDESKTTSGKKKFTFIVVFLYSPQRFFGGKMSDGLRKIIGRTLKVNSPNYISLIFPELMFDYTTYSDFRDDVDKVIHEVELRLMK